MAREKKKAGRPADARPAGEAEVSDFSGLGADAPPPVVVAPAKGRAAGKGGSPMPAPTPADPASAKPRSRKASVAPPGVPLLPAPAPPPSGGGGPAPDFSGQAREAAKLLDEILQQCREARGQLRRESEERQGVDREIEGLRQRSQEAHERLLRDAQEARGLHEKLLAEATEARAAHQQLLVAAREGAEQVKREHAAAAAQLTAAGREAEKRLEQSRGAHEALSRELGEGVARLTRECAAAAQQVAAAARQVEALQPKVQDIQESLLYEVKLASAGAEQVKQERAAAAGQLAEAGAEFAEARRQFFEGFEQGVGRLHHHLRQAGESMQDLPRRAEEFRQRLAEAGAEVRAFEAAAATARRQRERLEAETAQAEARLATLRAEVADAERRRAAPEREPIRTPAEPARPVPEPAAEVAPAPPPEPRNHLGIAVEPGVVVAEVTPGTPAAAGGLIRGDVITAVNGIPVLSGPELRDLIHEEEVGEAIVLSLTRGGLAAEARIRFEARPEGEGEVPLGATVESGVVVAEVTPGTPGAAGGLIRGDIITAVNGAEVFTGAQLRDVVQALAGGARVTLRFTRAGEKHEASTRLDEATAAPL